MQYQEFACPPIAWRNAMKKKLVCFALVLVLMLTLNFSMVSAQTYLFQVDKTIASVYINNDGTMDIEYWITFTNDPSASAIDFVDIGLPNSSYSLSRITAEVDGTKITDIQKSPYVTPGIALGLGSKAIRAGGTGTVHARITGLTNTLYISEVDEFASFNFSPNYFGKQYVKGSTEVIVTLYLPVGLEPEEPRYHTPQKWTGTEEPQSGYDDEGRVYYRWTSDQANSYSQYIFGASFPARLVPETVIQKPPSAVSGFFNSDNFICICFNLVFFGFFGLIVYASVRGQKARKMKYLPPKIAIEGHGIKRGLTAVEAAVLLEQPVDKIMTMTLFSVIKKGAATVLSQEPLQLEVADPLPEGLHTYEKEFVSAFALDKTKQRKALQDMMVNVIKEVTNKMKGFSRKETIAYYQDIMERAWKHVEAAETPDVKMEKFDEYMGWTMLDKNFDSRTRRTFDTGPLFVPMWWGRYDPTFRPVSSGGSSAGKAFSAPASSGSGKTISVPNLPGSNFAASVVNGTQAFAAGALGNLTNFTSAVTNKTNPAPKPSSSSYSSGSGGGRSCACACACAGCACACAGGGR
jgi:hypothetical protein